MVEFHHKPMLWHGWREFLREYAIVVVGVLTAAAVGLAVDWLHRSVEVAEARKALRTEIADNAGNARVLIEEERCLGAGEASVIDVGNGAARPPSTRRPPIAALPGQITSTWDVVKAGAAARMPFEERVAYSRFYGSLAVDLANSEHEVAALERIFGQAAVKAAGTPEDRRRLIEDAAQAQVTGTIRARQARKRLAAAKAMGITPTPPDADARADLASLCGLMGMTPDLAP